MALFGSKAIMQGLLSRSSVNRLAVIHFCDVDSRQNIVSRPAFDFNSRRHVLGSPRMVHYKPNKKAKWSKFRVGIAVGSAAFLLGLILRYRRKSSSVAVVETSSSSFSTAALSDQSFKMPEAVTPKTVSAATSLETTGISPSKRFNFIADVVDIAAPAVVYIELKERHPFGNRMVTTSNGSGFIVDSNGLIMTNAHVVANKAVVSIRFYDGKEMEGHVVAVDPVSDLAAVKVNATGLPVLKMGQSSSLRAGEWVVAMGSPLALSNTVTCGIVSSTQRRSKDLGIRNKDMDYIQTDALINFGNSGGPLVNLNGEVIGINTMKVTPGISFAIPSDYASNFLSKVNELLKRGDTKQRQWFGMGPDSTRKRFIGITMLTLNPELIMELKTRVPDFPDIGGGVLIHKLIVGSPAYKGGLRAGDIIVEINGKPIQSASDVYKLVESSKSLEIVAYRGHLKKTLTVHSEEIS